MPRKKKQAANPTQTELLDITARLKTGVCVPALREAVKAWRAGGYKGITDTTRLLLNHWFQTRPQAPDWPSFQVPPLAARSD